MTHIIQTLRWQVDFRNPSPTIGVDEEVSQLTNSASFQSKLIEILSACVPKNQWLKIDKLEIDVGNIAEENWQSTLTEKLLHQLKEVIENKKSSSKSLAKESVKNSVETLLKTIETGNRPNAVPSAVNDVKSLLAWLETLENSNAVRLKAEQQIAQNKALITGLSRWPLSVFWFYFFQEKEMRNVLKKAQQWEQKLAHSSEAVQQFRADVWHSAWAKTPWQKVVENRANIWFSTFLKAAKKREVEALKSWIEKQHIPLKNVAPVEPIAEQSTNEKTKNSQPFFIRNAGFVLLAPFLAKLFLQLKIVKKKNIKNPSKAMALLQYLCAQKVDASVLDNALFKVLLGVSPETVLLPEEKISPKETAEANALMQSAIAHWKALKNTSAEGFREGFLMREGKLWFENDRWNLKVESKAQDVLLGFLPWSISIIKLPWMPHALHVDWA